MSIKARTGRTKSLNALINKDTSIFGQVLNKAAYLKQLETLVKAALPAELRDFFRVANYQNQRLTLLTGSAGNLTQLRFLEQELIRSLKKQLPELEKIEALVRPDPPPARPKIKKTRITPHARKVMAELANEIQHARLKASLHRIANHKEENDQ
ncbi:DciA family protein [Marinospirillum alkaliphilum]|uniref:DUF721 domain-containing protein n=1 Tax=Marinospirillum alkaliphilum DSM 21637 TaxID=1122209 RepID=A0A1K1TSG5_9GAMM|nr:DciA family protein [Marinospirillum alkaliphilum]SFX03394.1 hypothetical protein SAMN02745752_00289 [Marinospirillum alkaliphilum DSM 21637]